LNRAEQSLQAARSALTRAQKDTQEAYMRYTSYREIEQQAHIAVTNAEKRRDDISKQWKHIGRDSLLIAYSGYHSSPKSDANGFVNALLPFFPI
jgi:predicted  nucleic acid-binding Zn-ribbon protein